MQDVWIRHGDQTLKMPNSLDRERRGLSDVSHSICVCSLPMTATVVQLAVEHKNFGPLKSNGVEVRSNKQQGFCLALTNSSHWILFTSP
nr:putative G3BP-like protein isoform X1 [Tanacetum cinerariifolium]GEV34222.1 putative G3BP-like protein isoform X1 [Tanacetum cinerariifolium]